MKKILIVLLAMVLLLAGCGKNGTSSPQSPSDESVADQQEPSSSETEISSEYNAIPGSYAMNVSATPSAYPPACPAR